jgi:hypothetical protein
MIPLPLWRPLLRIGVNEPLFGGAIGVPVTPYFTPVRGLMGSNRGQMRGLWGLKQGGIGGYN